MWEQIVKVGYCDMNTTRESIERQTKYHRTKTNVSMCQKECVKGAVLAQDKDPLVSCGLFAMRC